MQLPINVVLATVGFTLAWFQIGIVDRIFLWQGKLDRLKWAARTTPRGLESFWKYYYLNVVVGHWSFYGRRNELGALLERMRGEHWFFGAIRGRRRIGKTALVQQALNTLAEDKPGRRPALLVQLPDSTPGDFAAVFRNALREAKLGGDLGESDEPGDLPGVAIATGSLCAAGAIVVLDEFQICLDGPLSPFPSLLQAQVDRLQNKQGPVGGLIVVGSVQTEMEALLEDRKAPLFGRTTFRMSLDPWNLGTVFDVCENHGAREPMRCLTLWTLFGGVPKYWRHFAETDGLDLIPEWEEWATELCERLFLRSDAPLREEGEHLLGHELRRTYLAILRTLAERRSCTHAELREALPELTSLGPYLKTLTRDLRLVEKELPVFAGESSRGARYIVSDPFLSAWLAAIQPACQAARILPASEVAKRFLPRLRTMEGHAFERMMRAASEEASRTDDGDFPLTDRVRGFWNRPRSNPAAMEIDLIAWNEEDRRVRFGSCKRTADRHDPKSLRAFSQHVSRFLSTSTGRRFAGWRQELALFSPRFSGEQRARLEAGDWLCRDLTDFRRMLHDEARGPRGQLAASPKIVGEE